MRHRILRSAILSAVNKMFADPATMAAIELLAESSQGGVNGMIDRLWRHPETLQAYHMCSLGIEYDPRKQAALLLVTGRDMAYWFGVPR